MSKELKLIYRGRVLSKKNSKRIIRNPRTGKPMMISNRAAKDNENSMIDQFSAQTLSQKSPIGECEIQIKVYEPNLQKRDLDNQATSILDALVGAEVIADDSIKCVKGITVHFAGVDRENPRAIVEICSLEQKE